MAERAVKTIGRALADEGPLTLEADAAAVERFLAE